MNLLAAISDLSKSAVTQESLIVGQKAHIYSFSSRWTRGNARISGRELNNIENLMLVCYDCHQKMDRRDTGNRFTVRLLQQMKEAHERRIARVAGISESKTSHILLYGANIGEHSSPLNYKEAAVALFPDRYPAADTPIDLTTVNSSFLDRDSQFWAVESENLRRKFQQRVRERLSTGGIEHLSVFPLRRNHCSSCSARSLVTSCRQTFTSDTASRRLGCGLVKRPGRKSK